MTKDKFIGMFLERKMKGHGLPYGLDYLNLLSVQEEKAEKAWKRFCKKNVLNKYTKKQIRLAGEIGEICSIDVEHLISLLDEAVIKEKEDEKN